MGAELEEGGVGDHRCNENASHSKLFFGELSAQISWSALHHRLRHHGRGKHTGLTGLVRVAFRVVCVRLRKQCWLLVVLLKGGSEGAFYPKCSVFLVILPLEVCLIVYH